MSIARNTVETLRTTVVDADIGSTVQAYDATIVNDADIGVTVQPYSASLSTTQLAAVYAASLSI